MSNISSCCHVFISTTARQTCKISSSKSWSEDHWSALAGGHGTPLGSCVFGRGETGHNDKQSDFKHKGKVNQNLKEKQTNRKGAIC